MAREWQFDGLVGPTHNYAGLALGNLAAAQNAGQVSNPRLAALQGLAKMKFVRNLGVPQAFLPPHYRPMVSELTRLGFTGDLANMLSQAAKEAPGVLASIYSSSFMWAANAATVSPSSNCTDAKLHLTPANLISHYHRSLESNFSTKLLRSIFHNDKLFSIHNAVSPANEFGDEGAANHMAICLKYADQGIEIFAYGQSLKETLKNGFQISRQKLPSCEAVVRLHKLKSNVSVLLQQSSSAINQGVFHNDVIAMNTTRRMIVHEEAFIPEHQKMLRDVCGRIGGLRYREVTSSELSVKDAVSTYLFNSQLLELAQKKFALVAPVECDEHPGARVLVEQFMTEGVLDEVHYLDVRESMRNGGGPACLRLRVVMTPEQEEGIHPGIILTDETYAKLVQWVTQHYRDRLRFDDLADPLFVAELDTAYEALEPIIGMPGLYDGLRYQQTVLT